MGDEQPCYKTCEVLAKLTFAIEQHKEINSRLDQVMSGNSKMIELLDEKLERLLTLLSQTMTNRDMIPISSFKQIAIWMMAFMFALQFGIPGVKELIETIIK